MTEMILGLLMMALLMVAGCCLFFLLFIQPIWGVIDVATSQDRSRGFKVGLILLTLFLLGPLLTFFYAMVGSQSRWLRRLTLFSFCSLVIAGGSLLALAFAVPALDQKLPWRNSTAQSGSPLTPTPDTNEISGVQVAVARVAPEAIPSFTAVHRLPNSTPYARPASAMAEFDGHGPKAQSLQPVGGQGRELVTHLAIDPQGPAYYGITTHEIVRIDPASGRCTPLIPSSGVPKPSWPSAIAYDSNQGLVLISARSTGFSFNPQSGLWKEIPWLSDDGIVALAYDSNTQALYGLQRESSGKSATHLLQFNAKGALVSKTPLSSPIAIGDYPSPFAQLVVAGEKLVSIVHPSVDPRNPAQSGTCKLYQIDPTSGSCLPIAKQE